MLRARARRGDPAGTQEAPERPHRAGGERAHAQDDVPDPEDPRPWYERRHEAIHTLQQAARDAPDRRQDAQLGVAEPQLRHDHDVEDADHVVLEVVHRVRRVGEPQDRIALEPRRLVDRGLGC